MTAKRWVMDGKEKKDRIALGAMPAALGGHAAQGSSHARPKRRAWHPAVFLFLTVNNRTSKGTTMHSSEARYPAWIAPPLVFLIAMAPAAQLYVQYLGF